ncbi:1-phosphofructokinase family hexose kinase [Dolosicoccus paucivorans]
MLHLICPNPALDRTLIVKQYQEGATNRPVDVRNFPGGKSFNVAYAINRLDLINQEFLIHTILGGEIGEMVERLAEEQGYSLEITPTHSNTRICSIIMNTNNGEVYPLYERGEKVSQELVTAFTNTLLEQIQTGDYVAFSGSFANGFPDNYIKQIFRELKARDVKICIDSSGPQLRQAYNTEPYMIKINDEELLDIFPNAKASTVEEYTQLLNSNWKDLPPYFIVTLGKDGVLAKMQNNLIFAKSKPINTLNPIASGDFFYGGLLGSMIEGKSEEDSVRTAISASTANCLNLFPEFESEQFEDVYHNFITVKKIK